MEIWNGNNDDMSTAAIIGTGLIGRGWAVVFARAGWNVHLWDRDPAGAMAAKEAVGQSLEDLEEVRLLTQAKELARNVRVCASLAEAVGTADYIQESAPEDRAIKAAVIAEIDASAPDGALIGSSTSTIGGSLFLAEVPGRHRAMVVHPANPPHLMPVVELVPSGWHDEATTQRYFDLLTEVGQVPVLVHKEVVGFVMNRLQTAVVNEAVSLVARGVVSPDGLDAVMKHSLGLRWAFYGPFQTMDLNAPRGFYDYATRFGKYYRQMGEDLNVTDPWPDETLQEIEAARRAVLPTENVAEGMRRRDQALMRLLALKSELENKNEG